jgi:copper homeostasis protein
MAQAKASGLETHVLIRPNSGDFELPLAAVETAIADIRCVKDLGLHGVVIGASYEGQLDMAIIKLMIEAAEGLHVTLHRVIDTLADPLEAVDRAIDLGIARILTSGGGKTAAEGVAMLAQMQHRADGHIEIMAGSGVNATNAAMIANETGITSFHASCSTSTSLDKVLTEKGFGQIARQTDEQKIANLSGALTDVFS